MRIPTTPHFEHTKNGTLTKRKLPLSMIESIASHSTIMLENQKPVHIFEQLLNFTHDVVLPECYYHNIASTKNSTNIIHFAKTIKFNYSFSGA